MDERIRELSKQAWEWAEQQEYNDPTQEFSDILEQKFAELIVKKCAELSRSHQDFPETEQTIRRWVAEDIERHFGVKE